MWRKREERDICEKEKKEVSTGSNANLHQYLHMTEKLQREKERETERKKESERERKSELESIENTSCLRGLHTQHCPPAPIS